MTSMSAFTTNRSFCAVLEIQQSRTRLRKQNGRRHLPASHLSRYHWSALAAKLQMKALVFLEVKTKKKKEKYKPNIRVRFMEILRQQLAGFT